MISKKLFEKYKTETKGMTLKMQKLEEIYKEDCAPNKLYVPTIEDVNIDVDNNLAII